MRRIALLAACLMLAACGDDPVADGGMDGSPGRDGSTGNDGSTGDDGSTGRDGSTGDDGGGMDAAGTDGATGLDAGMLPDAGPCTPAACSGMVWACANCMDDDMDGLIDALDPDCTGACDNNEAGYQLMIPGSDTPNCALDCYYDDDQGPGNDRCQWNSSCDPLAPEDPLCPFTGPGMGVFCPDPQDPRCLTNCLPITPNGCDCFGCCELPSGSGSFVFLGSRPDDGAPPCSAATATSPASCHPCTPVMACFNPCGRCELCLGRDPNTIPCDCFEPGSQPARCLGVDAGPPGDAGPRLDGGSSDAGMPSTRCPPGRQPCGLPTDPACPPGDYCQTGCCAVFM